MESLCKDNYRSVNILTVTSKCERIIADQLMSYLDNLVHIYLITEKDTAASMRYFS